MRRLTTKGMNPRVQMPARRRLVEIGLGLFFVLLAIVATRIWIELKNTRRADSYAMRRGVTLTFEAADRYDADEPMAVEVRQTWKEFLNRPPGQKVPTVPAHEFMDSFVVSYQDGVLDSAEASALYRQLAEFQPTID